MTKTELMRKGRVYNTILLTWQKQLAKTEGWTTAELASVSKTNWLTIKPFINQMINRGYVKQLPNRTYTFAKVFNINHAERIAELIATNWDKNVYKPNTTPKRISEFTTAELEAELCKRKTNG